MKKYRELIYPSLRETATAKMEEVGIYMVEDDWWPTFCENNNYLKVVLDDLAYSEFKDMLK